METVDEFLAATMPRLQRADTELHNGDVEPRVAVWSHHDPVTLFGAAATESGWAAIRPVFDRLASTFSQCRSFEYQVIAADVSGDLAYVVGIEHTACSIGGTPQEYSLRVTTILRREEGEWKVVHRHGDRPPAEDALERLTHAKPGL